MMISATFVLPRMQHGGKLREKDAFDLKVPKRQMFISGEVGGGNFRHVSNPHFDRTLCVGDSKAAGG